MNEENSNKLPKGWKEEKIGSNNFKILGSGIERFEGEKDYLSTESIQGIKIEKIESKISYKKRPLRANMQPVLNSVWFAKMKGTTKVYCFDETNKSELNKYILSTGFAGINPLNCKAKFLKYFFLSPNFNLEKDNFSTGTTQVAINNDRIKKIEIIYPESIEEQILIVQEIEKHFTNLDAAVKSLKLVKNKLGAYRKSVLKAAFEGRLVEKRSDLNYKKLSELCDINPSKKEVKDFDIDTEVTFLPMASVSKKGKIVYREKKKIKDVIKGYTYFKDGDVLLAKITPCFENGKRAIAKDLKNGIGFGSTEFHIIRPKEKVTSDWIFFSISRDDFKNEAKNKMTGTAGQKRVPARIVENFKIPVPKVQEQTQIVSEIESRFSVIDKLEETVDNSLLKAEQLRKSILKSAFEGKLVKYDGGGEK
ncbi:MAG: hypothetical protein GW779_01560 [Candidatus Altiarchaeum hamiconexum]|uniref:Type I restriction modification DNA specificity domain-containing protein n=2 Tax=Candidatus Altarchaeum hamiconexum TaxID=1803513 RepID=A0A8J8CK69_9ARCH|nr:hypothetical protein [Candidatus Altarchaeum hamiconexum]